MDANKTYLVKDLKEYTTFPPLYLLDLTRWGTQWNAKGFEVDMPDLKAETIDKYPIVYDEAQAYT